MKKREKKWLRKHIEKVKNKAFLERSKEFAQAHATSRRNSVYSLFDGAGFTIPELIALTRNRYDDLRDAYRLNEAITEMIKDKTLVINESGYIDRNWERLWKRVRKEMREEIEAEQTS